MAERTTEPTSLDAIPLDGVIRRYDWGSRTSIQQLLGDEPDGRPAAELWFGAHPGDPCPTPEGPLDEVIAGDPDGLLGPHVVAEFGPRLPFLLKVLAADTALSIQVHPNLAQARAGYDAEQAAGGPHRNYPDGNHKPELLCALTPFEALCGFRPVAATLAVLAELALPELAFLGDALRGADPLRSAFSAVLSHDDPSSLARTVAAAATLDGPLRPAALAAEHFAGDVGVVLTLLLNHVRLLPGEAIYLGAGNVHAYLRGTGVEIMASSDNVLRCGLTAKHVDVDEVLRISDFTELREPRWQSGGAAFDVPVPDFRLWSKVPVASSSGPRIVLCIDGSLRAGGQQVGPGRAMFVPPGTGGISATGRVFVAEVGR